MEENENKKPDETEGEKPEDNVTPTPEEKKDDKKNKVAAFFAPKRNKIIVGVSAAALIALIIGLSVGLSKCGSGNGGATISSNSGEAPDSKGGDTSINVKITSDTFAPALIFNGDKFTITLTETSEVTTMVKNGTAVHWTNTAGTGSEEYYSKVTESGSTKYYIYTKDSSGTWTKNEDNASSPSYEYYATRDVNKDLFDDKLTYAGLTFNDEKKGYTLSYTDDYEHTSVNAELYFANSRLTKAVKTEGSETEIYTFSDTAEAIELPSDAHMHTFLPGTLDLNSKNADFTVTCSGCGKTQTKERLESDSIGTVLYGYYPQTHVSDSTTIASLNELTAPESNGWYKLGDDYYAKATASVYGSIGSFDDGVQIVTSLDYWFKVEPIEWRVLTNSDGDCSLVSNLLLDAHRYSADFSGQNASGYYANNYAQSELKSWLNGDFLSKAFSLGSSYLKTVTVDNSASTICNSESTYASSNTEDKVYLLSYADYDNASYFPSLDSKKCKLSDWARANYAYDPSIAYTNPSHYGQYWTRSPSPDSSRKASYVDQDGNHTYDAYVDQAYTCVRPAITVKLPAAIDHQHKDPASGSLDLNSGKAMFSGECPDCGETITREYASTDKISSVLYGYYPQTHVSDTTITAKLDTLTAESNGWYLLDGTYYAKATQNVEHYDTTFDDGTKIMYSAYYWFKVEPIEWNILSISNGQYSLVSKLILDTHAYDANTSNNYEDSDIREWLTGDFYDKAFAKDSAYLVTVNVDNSAATTDADPNAYACTNTDDKVYLLSYQDYQNTAYFADAAARQCKTSEWTRNNQGQCNMEDNYAGTYWTRSPHSGSENCVWFVDGRDGGNMDYEDSAKTYFSVRPAITVKLS